MTYLVCFFCFFMDMVLDYKATLFLVFLPKK
jgi:hypothetical protein